MNISGKKTLLTLQLTSLIKQIDQHSQLLLMLALSLCSVGFAYVIAFLGIKAGILLLGAIVGIPFLVLCIIDLQVGFITIFLVSSFVFVAKRFVDAPFGIIPEVLTYAAFIGVLIKRKAMYHTFQNPITFMVGIWLLYLLIQALNPNATSMAGWLFGARGILNMFFTYIILMHVFDSLNFVNIFTKVWLGIALLAAIYGLYQEFAGLPSYDLAWVTSTKQLIGLNFIQGRWRKWSFLSDCTAFGMFMAISSIFCSILLLGPYSRRKKLLLLISSLLMLLSMSYSGTRTAYAMIPAGFLVYAFLTLNRRKTLLAGATFLFLFIAILTAPVHNSTINRIRSAFVPTQDASMNVREVNRARIQPYIYAHPFGGGLTTTGPDGVRFSPNHILAGFPPDSGYLKVTLETGWVGLIIVFTLYFVIIVTGISNYFKAKDPHIRALYAAYISIFFALTVANFAQASISQLPYGFVLYAIYILMPQLIKFDTKAQKIVNQ